jgi:hypothetical protein
MLRHRGEVVFASEGPHLDAGRWPSPLGLCEGLGHTALGPRVVTALTAPERNQDLAWHACSNNEGGRARRACVTEGASTCLGT